MTWKAGDPSFSALKFVVVDDEPHMRKVARALLHAIGVRQISEAGDGARGLELIEQHAPDIVLLDWEMPYLNGPEFMRIVRSPGRFAYPQVPVIMLTGHSERARVMEAMTLGVNEFLLKPVSAQSLADRVTAIIQNPRPFVRNKDGYFGPAPRALPKLNNYPPKDLVMV